MNVLYSHCERLFFLCADEYGVLFLSMKAGGVGLNLAVGTAMIILNPPYCGSVQSQMVARICRRGQKRDVVPIFQLYISGDGSIESAIFGLHQDKDALADYLLHNDDENMGDFDAIDTGEEKERKWLRESRIVNRCVGIQLPEVLEDVKDVLQQNHQMIKKIPYWNEAQEAERKKKVEIKAKMAALEAEMAKL